MPLLPDGGREGDVEGGVAARRSAAGDGRCSFWKEETHFVEEGEDRRGSGNTGNFRNIAKNFTILVDSYDNNLTILVKLHNILHASFCIVTKRL